MNSETLLVTALVLGMLSLVSVLGAWIEGRRPRVAIFAMLVTGILFAVSVRKSDDGFQLHDIPDALVIVIAGFIN